MKKTSLLLLIIFSYFIHSLKPNTAKASELHSLQIRSIDTMKFSRDLVREKVNDLSFNEVIDSQMKYIVDSGATHVTIDAPYDQEFLPMISRWVLSARQYKLNVWFRGNFSGWEGWYEYPRIDRATHLKKTQEFILNNPDLFADGDIFTACPECENGGPGDPRNGDVEGYRKFLFDEYDVTTKAFEKIDKKVHSNFLSMNGDVAELIMDRETTKRLGGLVTIDHYVKTPERTVEDIIRLAEKSGGKIVLGEVGVPLTDLHGNMTEKEQAEWLARAFAKFEKIPDLIAVNYWVNAGGTTGLWEYDGKPRLGSSVLKNYFLHKTASGKILNTAGKPISDATVTVFDEAFPVNPDGTFTVPFLLDGQKVQINAIGYISEEYVISADSNSRNIVIKSADSPSTISNLKVEKKNTLWTLLLSPIIFLFHLFTQ